MAPDPWLISEGSLAWLAARAVPVAADDLRLTYAFAHPFNLQRTLTESVDFRRDDGYVWKVAFSNASGSILEEDLARKLFPDAALYSESAPTRGRVVANMLLRLAEAYRCAGFSRALYEAEEALYRRWGVQEIHLTAMWDGLVVWPRFGFLAEPALMRTLCAEYGRWARKNNVPPASDLASFDKRFLASRRQLQLFKKLA